MPLLLDFAGISPSLTDCCLEDLAKAVSYGRDEHLADPVPNRWARPLVEAVTHRLASLMDAMQRTLLRFLSGHPEDLRKADTPWLRWDEGRFAAVRLHLEGMTPATMSMDDYALLIEWLINRYLPAGVIETEADFLAVRAAFMAKIQANLDVDHRATDRLAETLLTLVPTSFAAVPPRVLTPLELAIMHYAKAHAGEYIRAIVSQLRHRMAVVILEHLQAGLLGQSQGTWQRTERRLFDEFATTNRDLRRIAVTEVGEAINQGYVAALQTGRYVRRQEAYRGACEFCASINGRTFQVVAPDAPDKDGETQVWAGKTNVGRSASPRRREGNYLVERTAEEMWWPAAGLQHPNCRGSWTPVSERPPEVSVDFFRWMQAKLDEAERTSQS